MKRRFYQSSVRLAARLAQTRPLISDFRRDKRANVAVTCAVAALPIIIGIGCVVDYSMATMVRAKLQAVADAASLAAVSINSPVVTAAKSMSGNGSVSGGSTYTENFFNSNLAATTGYTGLTSTATVTKSGTQINATLTFSANVPTLFMGAVGYKTVALSGTSTANYTMPTYIDFYLMIDVSGSMSFPSTASEQTRLTTINPDNYTLYPNGCTFACHFTAQGACPDSEQKYSTGGYCEGFNLTRTAGNVANTPVTSCPTPGTSACIQLRADAVGYAVTQLLQTASASEHVTNQFQVGLYPFVQNLYSYFPMTKKLNGSATNPSTINYAAAQLATLLDTGNNPSLGSGGTHFENAFPAMNTLIKSVGTGSNAGHPLPYVFLITDGAQDSQTQWNGSWAGSNQATLLDPYLCTPLKNRGITIAILYIPYQPIQNPTNFAGGEDFAVNAIIPDIPTNLRACASPNFFYTANSPADITNALITMFEQAASTAHISN